MDKLTQMMTIALTVELCQCSLTFTKCSLQMAPNTIHEVIQTAFTPWILSSVDCILELSYKIILTGVSNH